MLRSLAALLLALAAGACSPTFNWREVRVDDTSLKAMLPCKPDRGQRRVAMGSAPLELSGIGCDTGGATFAILHAELGDATRAAALLQQWHLATLANLHGTATATRPFAIPGGTPLAAAQRVSMAGRRADGSPVRGEAAYFARGSQVFQAVVYAAEPRADWVQPFFEGLRFE